MSENAKVSWVIFFIFTIGFGSGGIFDNCVVHSENCFTAKEAKACDIFTLDGKTVYTVSWPYPEDKQHKYCSVPDIMVRCKGPSGEPACFEKVMINDDVYNFPEWGICPATPPALKAEAEPGS